MLRRLAGAEEFLARRRAPGDASAGTAVRPSTRASAPGARRRGRARSSAMVPETQAIRAPRARPAGRRRTRRMDRAGGRLRRSTTPIARGRRPRARRWPTAGRSGARGRSGPAPAAPSVPLRHRPARARPLLPGGPRQHRPPSRAASAPGKTVLLQQIAKWCDADVIVYVGCGERGQRDGRRARGAARRSRTRAPADPLLDRTVLIANTSNMPVLAREASIHTGVTVAEYYRDMGYDAVLIADSTSRWAEALREVASRTGELPAEEGYPASLASALAAFYERAAAVTTLGGREGSVTILGAVSPPGGDMTEPVERAHAALRALRLVARPRPRLRAPLPGRELARLLVARRRGARRLALPASGTPAGPSGDARARPAGRGRPARVDRAARRRRLAPRPRARRPARRPTSPRGRAAAEPPERERRLLRRPPSRRRSCALVLAVHDRCLALVERGVAAERIEAGRPLGRSCARAGADAARRRRRGGRARRAGAGAARRSSREPACAGRVLVARLDPRARCVLVEGVRGRRVGRGGGDPRRLGRAAARRRARGPAATLAVVQVFEGTGGLGLDDVARLVHRRAAARSRSARRGSGASATAAASRSTAARPCSAPSGARSPAARSTRPRRDTPSDPILTGVSAIDGLATLVRGQKLPIFSVGGLPHLELAAQVAAQARAGGTTSRSRSSSRAMGVTHADAAMRARSSSTRASRSGDLVLFLNTADDPLVERIATPRIALTVAEHLAFDLGPARARRHRGHDELLRGGARGVLGPGRDPQPARLPGLPLQRPGLALRARRPHPGPARLGHAAPGAHHARRGHDASGARSHRLHHGGPAGPLRTSSHVRGVYPPFDPLALAVAPDAARRRARADPRRPPRGRGAGVRARSRRPVASPTSPRSSARTRCPSTSALHLELAELFDARFLSQGRNETRSLEETLDRAWEVVSVLPRRELSMLPAELLDRHHRGA